MKRDRIIFLIVTGLLSAMMLMSAGMYIFNNAEIQQVFTTLGFPTYVIYPLALAKLLGVIVLWVPSFKVLKEWAYAGFFFNFVLAFFAHYMISDGEQGGAVVATVLLFLSYIFYKRLNK